MNLWFDYGVYMGQRQIEPKYEEDVKKLQGLALSLREKYPGINIGFDIYKGNCHVRFYKGETDFVDTYYMENIGSAG